MPPIERHGSTVMKRDMEIGHRGFRLVKCASHESMRILALSIDHTRKGQVALRTGLATSHRGLLRLMRPLDMCSKKYAAAIQSTATVSHAIGDAARVNGWSAATIR